MSADVKRWLTSQPGEVIETTGSVTRQEEQKVWETMVRGAAEERRAGATDCSSDASDHRTATNAMEARMQANVQARAEKGEAGGVTKKAGDRTPANDMKARIQANVQARAEKGGAGGVTKKAGDRTPVNDMKAHIQANIQARAEKGEAGKDNVRARAEESLVKGSEPPKRVGLGWGKTSLPGEDEFWGKMMAGAQTEYADRREVSKCTAIRLCRFW